MTERLARLCPKCNQPMPPRHTGSHDGLREAWLECQGCGEREQITADEWAEAFEPEPDRVAVSEAVS